MKTVIKGGDAVKTVNRRDSATTMLRKLGIKSSDYNMFIHQTTDGRFAVALDKAQEHLAARLRLVANEEVPQQQLKGRTKKEAESNQIKRPSVAATIRKLILDGHDNKAIHEVMKRDFGHDEDKSHYPAWYRSQMRREGLIERPSKVKKTPKGRSTTAHTFKRDKPIKSKKQARVAKRVKQAERKQVKASAKKKPTSRAQSNIDQTKRASVKTGGRAPSPGRLSVTLVN